MMIFQSIFYYLSVVLLFNLVNSQIILTENNIQYKRMERQYNDTLDYDSISETIEPYDIQQIAKYKTNETTLSVYYNIFYIQYSFIYIIQEIKSENPIPPDDKVREITTKIDSYTMDKWDRILEELVYIDTELYDEWNNLLILPNFLEGVKLQNRKRHIFKYLYDSYYNISNYEIKSYYQLNSNHVLFKDYIKLVKDSLDRLFLLDQLCIALDKLLNIVRLTGTNLYENVYINLETKKIQFLFNFNDWKYSKDKESGLKLNGESEYILLYVMDNIIKHSDLYNLMNIMRYHFEYINTGNLNYQYDYNNPSFEFDFNLLDRITGVNIFDKSNYKSLKSCLKEFVDFYANVNNILFSSTNYLITRRLWKYYDTKNDFNKEFRLRDLLQIHISPSWDEIKKVNQKFLNLDYFQHVSKDLKSLGLAHNERVLLNKEIENLEGLITNKDMYEIAKLNSDNEVKAQFQQPENAIQFSFFNALPIHLNSYQFKLNQHVNTTNLNEIYDILSYHFSFLLPVMISSLKQSDLDLITFKVPFPILFSKTVFIYEPYDDQYPKLELVEDIFKIKTTNEENHRLAFIQEVQIKLDRFTEMIECVNEINLDAEVNFIPKYGYSFNKRDFYIIPLISTETSNGLIKVFKQMVYYRNQIKPFINKELYPKYTYSEIDEEVFKDIEIMFIRDLEDKNYSNIRKYFPRLEKYFKFWK